MPIGGEVTRIIHVFDREGDIAEVFLELSKTQNTGVVVRAAHNRCLLGEDSYLWSYLTSQPVQFTKEIKLPETKKRIERNATLEVKYSPVSIQPPSRLKDLGSFNVYAVYAREINVPEGCEPVEWMLLTSECVSTAIGIQVLWRGWLKLETLCQGWLLHQNLKLIH